MTSPTLKTDIQVRYGDLDTLGHVNNAVYLTYFELGRVLYFRNFMKHFDVRGIRFVIARAEIDFRKSIEMENHVTLETSIESIGNSSFTFVHRITERDTGEVFCNGKIIAVSLDDNGKPTRVPDHLRAMVSS
ncbi:MAG: acyl-CoA thioesterase [Candidatus Thermoplasmatota archaeon]|nr:acyl-CoA thioesterase [Candidatus Thermoplasmatota archaeon]